MAEVKIAEVRRNEVLRGDACRLSLQMTEPLALGHHGGQYIIVHTGLVSGDGKPVKRTYSIVSSDRDQQRLELLVQGLGQGSRYMLGLRPGSALRFSGPWGKKPLPSSGRVWMIATDTGISAALGLSAARDFAALQANARLLWLQNSEQPLLASEALRARLPAGMACSLVSFPPVGHGERVRVALAQLQGWLGMPDQVLLSGDGIVLAALKDSLTARGVHAERIIVENFFNKPPA